MPGLFDSLFSDENSANLALAAGLLGGKGSFNQILSKSLIGAQEAGGNAIKRKMMALQLEEAQRQNRAAAQQEAIQNIPQQFYQPERQVTQSVPLSPDRFVNPDRQDAATQTSANVQTTAPAGMDMRGLMNKLYATPGGFNEAMKLQQQLKKDTPTITSTAPGAVSHYFDASGNLQTIQGPPVKPQSDSPDIQALKLIYGDGTPEFAAALKGMMDKKNHTIPQGFNRDEKGNLTVDPNWLSAQIKIHQAAPQATAAGRQATTETALLPQEDRAFMAQQYLAGDKSVMQNLGRGAQGAANIVALRGEIRKQMQASGMSGADMAAKLAEYAGLTAAQRTVGTRTANIELAATEAEKVIPLAKQASNDVARSGLLPFGKVQVMFDEQTNDPALRKFAAANNALVNVYARAIAPTGTPTVHDKEHARAILSTAFDQKSYNAVLEQMQAEIAAARAAPKDVRKAFSEAVSPKSAAVDDLVNKWATKP